MSKIRTILQYFSRIHNRTSNRYPQSGTIWAKQVIYIDAQSTRYISPNLHNLPLTTAYGFQVGVAELHYIHGEKARWRKRGVCVTASRTFPPLNRSRKSIHLCFPVRFRLPGAVAIFITDSTQVSPISRYRRLRGFVFVSLFRMGWPLFDLTTTVCMSFFLHWSSGVCEKGANIYHFCLF